MFRVPVQIRKISVVLLLSNTLSRATDFLNSVKKIGLLTYDALVFTYDTLVLIYDSLVLTFNALVC